MLLVMANEGHALAPCHHYCGALLGLKTGQILKTNWFSKKNQKISLNRFSQFIKTQASKNSKI
jgi:hypothetical protein